MNSPDENPIRHELHHLEDVAEAGESAETPLILGATIWFVCAIIFVILLAIALLAYRLAS